MKNDSDLRARVQTALDRIRPALHADGGDAELLEISPEGVVSLKLKGACGGCAMASMTLRNGIERVIRSEVPEITGVVAVQEE